MKRFIMFWLLMLPPGYVGFADASAQSLAEVAKKEKERRKAVGKTEVRTYDDSSLGGRGRSVQFVPAADDSGTDAGQVDEAAEEEAQEEDPTKTQAYWRDRKAGIEKRISDIEGQLNHPGFSQDPDNLMRRSNLERQLEQARSDLSALQAEARRKGIPPGWVR
ncbi:MAG: hypothetical protein V3V11_05950 [Vicinamibacteria bacterium]